jgi:hypothetical protein
MGYLASILIKALEQGTTEERLANIEAILMKSGTGSAIFQFKSMEGSPS